MKDVAWYQAIRSQVGDDIRGGFYESTATEENRLSSSFQPPKSPNLGGLVKNWGTPPNPHQRGLRPSGLSNSYKNSPLEVFTNYLATPSVPQSWGTSMSLRGVHLGGRRSNPLAVINIKKGVRLLRSARNDIKTNQVDPDPLL